MKLIFILLVFSISILTKGYCGKVDTSCVKLCDDSLFVNTESNDTIIFKDYKNKISNDSVSVKSLPEIIEYTARYFLNTPYGHPARHKASDDQLMISFNNFDCVTFVETVLALAENIKNNKKEFCDFAEVLKKIRYRNGIINSFPSRLHYFSEWIYDNEKKKIVEDQSGKIDTVPWKKKINYITTHKGKYPQLYDTCFMRQICNTEKELTSRSKFFLPKDKFENYKSKINTGDILVLTVNTGGLDVSHTGFAIWLNSDIYFIHASKSKHKVTITSVPFKEYIDKIKKVTGVLVARPL